MPYYLTIQKELTMKKIKEYLKRKKEELQSMFSEFKNPFIVLGATIILAFLSGILGKYGYDLIASWLNLIVVFLQFYMLMAVMSIAINGILTEYITPKYEGKEDVIKAFIAFQKNNHDSDSTHFESINEYIEEEKQALQKKSVEEIRLMKKVRCFKNQQKKESVSLTIYISILAVLGSELIKRLLGKLLMIEPEMTFDFIFNTILYLILFFIFLSLFRDVIKKIVLYRQVKEFNTFIYNELFEEEK